MCWQLLLDRLAKEFLESEWSQTFESLSTNEERIKFCLESNFVVESLKNWWIDVKNETASRHSRFQENAGGNNETFLVREKSHRIAEAFRKEGNRYFAKRENAKALEFYNRSIRYSPISFVNNGINCFHQEQVDVPLDKDNCPADPAVYDIALAYANRSAVLNDNGQYREGLEDIERALRYSYPENLKYKLYKRRAEIMLKQGKLDDAKFAALMALACVEDSKDFLGKPELKKAMVSKIRDICRCTEFGEFNEKQNDPILNDDAHIPQTAYGSNKQLVYAGNCVEVKFNSDVGRYVVATKPLPEGSIIIVEKPYASVLLPRWYETNCHHCYDRLIAPVPCPCCSVVSYCSEECQQQSWKEYHHIECDHLEVLHATGVAHLALRIILVTSQDMLHKINKIGKDASTTASNHNGTYCHGSSADGTYGKGYDAVYHLVEHSEDMKHDDLFSYTLTATFLLMLLESSNYFQKWSRDSTDASSILSGTNTQFENLTTSSIRKTSTVMTNYNKLPSSQNTKLLIGGLLCRHMLQIVSNAHAITELHYTNGSLPEISEQEQVRIATAIYPTASLMNHSCEPTIVSSFVKNTLIVRVVRPVKAGEEIFSCYGPHYKRMPWLERQNILKQQYFFHCKCRPCQEGAELEGIFSALKCQSCSGPVLPVVPYVCRSCKKLHDHEQLQEIKENADEIFQKGSEFLSINELDFALSQLSHSLEIKEAILYKDHKEIAVTHDAIARCSVAKKNYQLAVNHLQKSVSAVENQFGQDSIELANELLKYSDVLILHIQAKSRENKSSKASQNLKKLIAQTVDVIHHASQTFVIHYGQNYKELDDLREKEAFLKHLI